MKKSSIICGGFVLCMSLQSCIGCGESSRNEYRNVAYPSYSSSSSSNSDISPSSSHVDENITNSREREQELRDAGMEGAANIERKARQEYEQGGGYTSTDGGRQVHYNGSREQQNDLRMIDEYFGF